MCVLWLCPLLYNYLDLKLILYLILYFNNEVKYDILKSKLKRAEATSLSSEVSGYAYGNYMVWYSYIPKFCLRIRKDTAMKLLLNEL